MMFSFFLSTSLALLALAVPRHGQPERCCVPKLFSAQISTSSGVQLPGGQVGGTYGYYNFSFDATRGLVGMKGVSFSIPDEKQSNLWIIENSNDGQVYTFDQDTKQCYKSTLPIKPLNCIPEDATFLHSFKYGYGEKQIVGNTWLVKMGNLINYATVSDDGLCVPLTGNIFLTDPPVATSVTTTDFLPEIVDPSVFDLPAACRTLL